MPLHPSMDMFVFHESMYGHRIGSIWGHSTVEFTVLATCYCSRFKIGAIYLRPLHMAAVDTATFS